MDSFLENWLAINNIEYILHTHPAVFTVEEAQIHTSHILGLHCKNLFLRDSKSATFYLITLPALKKINLNKLRKKLQAKKLSFAKHDQLKTILGLEPGSVSPLGLVNDSENIVIFYIETSVWEAKIVSFHPNDNSETLELSQAAFHRIIKATNNQYYVADF